MIAESVTLKCDLRERGIVSKSSVLSFQLHMKNIKLQHPPSLADGAELQFVKHHELVMHKNSEQKNNRQRDADQPEKCTFSKAHF